MSGPVTISNVAARLFVVPLDEVLVDAKHGAHSHFHLITATVTLSDGRQGTGYTYTGGRGGHAIAAMIRHDLAPFLTGREAADTAALNEAMDWHLHYVGRGGVLSFAISAVDIALWDLDLKARGLSLVRAAGGASDRCRAYGGGIDLGFDLPKLLAQTQGYLDAGLDAIKIKVGQPEPAQDIARIAAVRAWSRRNPTPAGWRFTAFRSTATRPGRWWCATTWRLPRTCPASGCNSTGMRLPRSRCDARRDGIARTGRPEAACPSPTGGKSIDPGPGMWVSRARRD